MAGNLVSTESESIWILKKAVTTLAIAPQTESLTRVGRLAYNVMLKLAQEMKADEDGGFSAPLSEIVRGFDSSTRDSQRVQDYIEQMCTTVVRWFPLSASDVPVMQFGGHEQGTLAGIESAPADGAALRLFTLLSEVRLYKRGGESWVTFFFPPSIREMLLEPSRYAQMNLKELARLSHYAGVVLAEICFRYLDSPGGLTNRGDPSWWMTMCRGSADTKPREWRKWKSETLKPALAEINQLTSMDVELIEFKRGRAVTSVQFAVKRKPVASRQASQPVDLSLPKRAEALGIRERDLDSLVVAHGEEAVLECLVAMELRLLSKPGEPIPHRLAYLKKVLRNATEASLFNERRATPATPVRVATSPTAMPPVRGPATTGEQAWLNRRLGEIDAEMDLLTADELRGYVDRAEQNVASSGWVTPSLLKRFKAGQFRSPVIWRLIRAEYARERYGDGWDQPPSDTAPIAES